MSAWRRKRWVQGVAVVAAFAVLGLVFWLVGDRKDAAYWSGYTTAQRWVDDGGYAAREESVRDFCQAQSLGQRDVRAFERGCKDGAHNALRPAR